jgi:hypothetical protein
LAFPELSPLTESIIAFGTFLGLAFGLNELNDKISEKLPKVNLRESIEKVRVEKDATEQLLILFEASKGEARIKWELDASGSMAFLAPVLGLIPVIIVFFGEEKTWILFIGFFYLLSVVLLTLAYTLNRIAKRACSRLPKPRATEIRSSSDRKR